MNDLGLCGRASFRDEARFQRVCAVCRNGGPYQAHHVVTEQVLRSRYAIRGRDAYNTFNVLRVCQRCHGRHHSRFRKIRTTELRDENLAYAFNVMGLYAAQWLRRYYDDKPPDQRIVQYIKQLESEDGN